MGALRLVLGDQLSETLSALDGIDSRRDVVLMAEVAEETTYVPHHKQKIVLVLSAMRHFAAALAEAGIRVDYVHLDDPGNTGTIAGEVERAAARHGAERVVVTAPGEWRLMEAMRGWQRRFGLPVEIREDRRFLCSPSRFADWAGGRKSLRMEFFYREMRRETGILMAGEAPAGGQWNFDAANRKALPRGTILPPRRRFPPDAITAGVMDLVAARFPGHFGDLETFGWPVTRAEALAALDDFVAVALPRFGDYQDAMKEGAAFLHHSLLSAALNIGLLLPAEVCARAERAFRDGLVPINAAEGFIRQILGWREYVRGIYWLKMPDYAGTNALDARRVLPDFYWTGDTPMNCVAEVVRQTRAHAYSHHIQRLMVTGNFALLAGIAPAAIEAWYLAVYADAFDWVELPNTHGMAIFADGGLLASKPYAASGAYIDRMSDFCASCAFSVRERTGPRACPFNTLYWAFLIRNEPKLARNPRLAMPYRTLARWDAGRRQQIVAEADRFLDRVAPAKIDTHRDRT